MCLGRDSCPPELAPAIINNLNKHTHPAPAHSQERGNQHHTASSENRRVTSHQQHARPTAWPATFPVRLLHKVKGQADEPPGQLRLPTAHC